MPLVLIVAAVVVLLSGLRIAQEYQRGVLFRLGRYRGLKGPGLFWIIPFGIETTRIIMTNSTTVRRMSFGRNSRTDCTKSTTGRKVASLA